MQKLQVAKRKGRDVDDLTIDEAEDAAVERNYTDYLMAWYW